MLSFQSHPKYSLHPLWSLNWSQFDIFGSVRQFLFLPFWRTSFPSLPPFLLPSGAQFNCDSEFRNDSENDFRNSESLLNWPPESRNRFRNGSIELLTESYSQIVVIENESRNHSQNHSQNHFLGGAIQLKFRNWFPNGFRDGNLGQTAERTCPNCQFRNSSQNHSQTAHFGMILRIILRIILRRVFGTIGSWDMW